MNQPKHTVVAGQAIGLAELFKFTVGKNKLEGPVSYSAELSAPDGPSTAGGKQALQHLKLVSEGGGSALVIGSANLVEKQAELRTFEHVDEAHRQRFKGAPFPVDMIKYNTLQGQIRKFFSDRDFTITTAQIRPTQAAMPVSSSHSYSRSGPSSGAATGSGGGSQKMALIVAIAVAVIAVVALIFK